MFGLRVYGYRLKGGTPNQVRQVFDSLVGNYSS
jgi:hypothetical protein